MAIVSNLEFIVSNMSRISLDDLSASAERLRIILTNFGSRDTVPLTSVIAWSCRSSFSRECRPDDGGMLLGGSGRGQLLLPGQTVSTSITVADTGWGGQEEAGGEGGPDDCSCTPTRPASRLLLRAPLSLWIRGALQEPAARAYLPTQRTSGPGSRRTTGCVRV